MTPLKNLSFIFAIKPIISEGKGITVLECCFSMVFFNRWKMGPHISISWWVKRSYKNFVLPADNVVRLETRYRLWIITYAKALISSEKWIVFMDDFFDVPPRISTMSAVDPNLSSYWTEIGWEGGRISKYSWMLSLVITNSLCLTQHSIRSPFTTALEKNSFMIS